MSTDFVMAQCDVSVQFVGGDYVNLGGELASFKPSMEAVLAEEIVVGREFPHYTLTGMTGGIEISGLRTGRADEVYEEIRVQHRQDAFFAVMHKEAMMLGPCGYVKLKSGDIMDSDGIFRLDGAGVAMPGDGFEFWRYGTILPQMLDVWKNQGVDGFPAPVGDQLAVINVIDPANATRLEVELNKGPNTYRLEAREESGSVVAGISYGYLESSGNAQVPSSNLTGYRWRIRTTGATGAVFYIGLVHLF